jgi:hypothetical protein
MGEGRIFASGKNKDHGVFELLQDLKESLSFS